MIMEFRRYGTVMTLRQALAQAAALIAKVLSPVGGLAQEDARRDEWDMLFGPTDDNNGSFQEWCVRPPECRFRFGMDEDYQIYTQHSGDAGGSNRVYFSLNNRVVKITEDWLEAEVAAIIVQGGHLPGVAVLDTAKLVTFGRMAQTDLYAIKQRLVNTKISDRLRMAVAVVQRKLWDTPADITGGLDARGRQDMARTVMQSREGVDEGMVQTLFDVIFGVLDRTGYLWKDLHQSNVGQDERGNPELFDLGDVYQKREPPKPKIMAV